eukprot:scaffold192790_cov29-Tisochrysis_lutea.AAC.1
MAQCISRRNLTTSSLLNLSLSYASQLGISGIPSKGGSSVEPYRAKFSMYFSMYKPQSEWLC